MTPSRPSAAAQSIVSATPGGLYSESSRSAATAAATWRASDSPTSRHAQPDDRHLAVEVGVLDPVVQAAPLEGVVDVAGAVARQHDERRVLGAEQAELGDRDLPVRQDLEQVGLELVVGAVDLVDEQHRRRALAGLDRPQQRPLDEEALLVQLGLEGVGRAPGRLAAGLGGPQVEQLAAVVPVVDGLGGVDALVALQADQLAAGPRRQHLGHLGLADAGLALQQQRPAQRDGQEHRRRQPLVGQVAVGGEGGGDLVDAIGADQAERSTVTERPTVPVSGRAPRDRRTAAGQRRPPVSRSVDGSRLDAGSPSVDRVGPPPGRGGSARRRARRRGRRRRDPRAGVPAVDERRR